MGAFANFFMGTGLGAMLQQAMAYLFSFFTKKAMGTALAVIYWTLYIAIIGSVVGFAVNVILAFNDYFNEFLSLINTNEEFLSSSSASNSNIDLECIKSLISEFGILQGLERGVNLFLTIFSLVASVQIFGFILGIKKGILDSARKAAYLGVKG